MIVWIHGGSLMYGTGEMYGPDRLAAGGAVVVSMNYRLGVMGFLSGPAVEGADGLGLEESPAEALRTGRFNRVPVLVGVDHDEERGAVLGQELAPGGAPMKPDEYEPAVREQFGDRADAVLARYPLSAFGSAGEALAAVRTDSAWSVPTLDTARLLAQWTPTRMYEFSERGTPWFRGYPAPGFEQRAQHMSELAYLFDLDLSRT